MKLTDSPHSSYVANLIQLLIWCIKFCFIPAFPRYKGPMDGDNHIFFWWWMAHGVWVWHRHDGFLLGDVIIYHMETQPGLIMCRLWETPPRFWVWHVEWSWLCFGLWKLNVKSHGVTACVDRGLTMVLIGYWDEEAISTVRSIAHRLYRETRYHRQPV